MFTYTVITCLKVHNDIALNIIHRHRKGHSTNTYRFISSFWHHWLFCSSWSPLWLVWHIRHSTYLDPLNENKKLFFKGNAFDLQCSPMLCSWTTTVYFVYLNSLIHSYHHLYADDTQLYISLSTADTDLSLKQLGDLLTDISGWMTNNKFRLNANKTDFIIIGTFRQCGRLTHFFH